MKQEFISLHKEAREVRKQVFKMIVKAHASHIASAFSCVELLVYLYAKVLRINPKNPLASSRDRFILSKGWGISALYAILARKGFFKNTLLNTYCQNNSKFIGIATKNGIPGIEATTGSVGHGLPIGVGMALAAKLKKKNYRTFVLMSDGECDAGPIWESALIAGHLKLDNLVVIIDYNKWQAFGRIKDILDLEPIVNKWQAFKWAVKEIDGHDFKEIDQALSKLPFKKNKPSIIVAHTIKGKGLSIIEDKNEWHYQTPTKKEIMIAKKELFA